MNRNLIVLLVAIVALIVGGGSLVQPNEKTIIERVIEKVGANPGPDYYNEQQFHNGIMIGADLNSTTTTSNAATLSANELDKFGYWKVNINTASDLTYTLPA